MHLRPRDDPSGFRRAAESPNEFRQHIVFVKPTRLFHIDVELYFALRRALKREPRLHQFIKGTVRKRRAENRRRFRQMREFPRVRNAEKSPVNRHKAYQFRRDPRPIFLPQFVKEGLCGRGRRLQETGETAVFIDVVTF